MKNIGQNKTEMLLHGEANSKRDDALRSNSGLLHLGGLLAESITQFFFFWPYLTACRHSVPQPGIKPKPLAVKVPSPNHWAARESPKAYVLD